MLKIGFLGAGRMASAMVKGLVNSGHYRPESIECTSLSGQSAQQLAQEAGVTFIKNADTILKEADVIILAFKPKSLGDFSAPLTERRDSPLILSILGGTSFHSLHKHLAGSYRLVRIMPNIPCEVGAGATLYTLEDSLPKEHKSTLTQFLNALGRSFQVSEEDLETLTWVTGCGPAYFYEFVEAFIAATQKAGISEAVARTCVEETFFGSARLLATSNHEAAYLRGQVASPGGMTEKKLKLLEENNFRNLIEKLVADSHK